MVILRNAPRRDKFLIVMYGELKLGTRRAVEPLIRRQSELFCITEAAVWSMEYYPGYDYSSCFGFTQSFLCE